jgi:hypothetical protein
MYLYLHKLDILLGFDSKSYPLFQVYIKAFTDISCHEYVLMVDEVNGVALCGK